MISAAPNLKGTIRVRMADVDSVIAIRAEGGLVLHETVNHSGTYTVTHAATGCAFVKSLSLGDATELLEALLKHGPKLNRIKSPGRKTPAFLIEILQEFASRRIAA